MSRLKDGIPPALGDHRTKTGRTYGAAVRAVYAQFPNLPPCARVLVKEYGRVVVELDQNGPAQERALARRRLTEARKLRREAKVLRFLLLKVYGQIERLAGAAGMVSDPLDALLDEEEETEQ